MSRRSGRRETVLEWAARSHRWPSPLCHSQAIKVVMLAQEEARRLGHNFVGTEQILLGLIGESTGAWRTGPLVCLQL